MQYLQKTNEPAEIFGEIVERKARKMFDARLGVIFIQAPAGYGKTELAALWARSQKGGVAWFNLNEGGCPADRDFSGTQTIVLDNFSAAKNGEAAELLAKVFAGRLVIISRNLPPAWLDDFIIKRRACVFCEEDLRLSKAEIKELFIRHGRILPEFGADAVCGGTGGWPALVMAIILFGNGINAFLMESIDYCCGKYFLSKIYRLWNGAMKGLLLKTALPDYIDDSYCKAVAEAPEGMEVLRRLSEETGFLLQERERLYFHPVFRKFLISELRKDKALQKPKLYSKAAEFLISCGHPRTALEIASEYGDAAAIEQTLLALRGLKSIDFGISELRDIIGRVNNRLADRAINDSPIIYNMLNLLDFIASEHETPNLWRFRGLFDELGSALFVPAITYNLPFLHKSRCDYSGILPRIEEFNKSPKLLSRLLWGTDCYFISKLLICGLLYEKNDIGAAQSLLTELAPFLESATPELACCYSLLNCEILFAQGKDRWAFEALKKAEEVITKSAEFLLPNLWAYKTKIALYRSDADAAYAWLENHACDFDSPLKLNQLFQNLTTARALIVAGKPFAAMGLLERLLEYAKRHRRTTDTIEILTISAACNWRTDKSKAAHCLDEAVIAAGRLGLIRPIIAECVDILPVLEYSLNRIRLGYCENGLDGEVLLRLYILSSEASKKSTGLFYNIPTNPTKLSKKQLIVLKLLSEGLAYEQIAGKMGVKITTVRDHIAKLYEKLGVNNYRDAIIKGRELELL